MDTSYNESLLREIEPAIVAAHTEHMQQLSAHSLSSAETISSAAFLLDSTIATSLEDTHSAADPLEYGPVCRKSMNSHLHELSELGIDGRPVIAPVFLVGILTEENLPYYVEENGRLGRLLDSLYSWVKQWTSEEKGHGVTMQEYAILSGLIGRIITHKEHQAGLDGQMKGGMDIRINTPAQGFSYLALQELATYVSHKRAGGILDKIGKRVLNKISGQEFNHYELYEKLTSACLDADPDNSVIAIRDQYRPKNFDMPGGSIPDFDALSREIAVAGILDKLTLAELRAKIIRRLGIADRTFTSDEAKRAQEELVDQCNEATIQRLGRVAAMRKGREQRIAEAKASGRLLPLILGHTVQLPSSTNRTHGSSPTTDSGLIVLAA